MKVLYTTVLILSTALFTGCGESSSTVAQSARDTISADAQVLMLRGSDTTTLGKQISLDDYNYSVGLDASFVVASGVLSNDPSSFLSIIAKPSVIAVSVLKDGQDWTYEFSCTDTCDALAFDAEQRTITFNDIQMSAYKDTVATSLSTAPLTLNGSISWDAADETSPAAMSGLAFVE